MQTSVNAPKRARKRHFNGATYQRPDRGVGTAHRLSPLRVRDCEPPAPSTNEKRVTENGTWKSHVLPDFEPWPN